MPHMNSLLLIAAGGAAGSVARHTLSSWIKTQMTSGALPWGILVVNVSGCLLFGLLHGFCHARGEEWKLALLTGLLGGYTTFSTFGWDTLDLIRKGQPGMAAAYAISSVVVGVLAVWLGVVLSGRASH